MRLAFVRLRMLRLVGFLPMLPMSTASRPSILLREKGPAKQVLIKLLIDLDDEGEPGHVPYVNQSRGSMIHGPNRRSKKREQQSKLSRYIGSISLALLSWTTSLRNRYCLTRSCWSHTRPTTGACSLSILHLSARIEMIPSILLNYPPFIATASTRLPELLLF